MNGVIALTLLVTLSVGTNGEMSAGGTPCG